MTIDDPTAQSNETEQAAAELRKLFDLVDETVDTITDDDIEQRWRNVCDRSELDVNDLINDTVDALTDDETEQRWRPIRDRSSLGGIRDGQHRLGSGIRGWSSWRETVPHRTAAEAAALEAMQAASRDHLAAVEYRLRAVTVELQAAEARLELAQMRAQEATARAARAEHASARAKEQAEMDAATAADALADAALERSHEIIQNAHDQVADLLADAQRQAAAVIAAAEEHAEQDRRETKVSSNGWDQQRLLFVVKVIELADSEWADSSSAVMSGECDMAKSAVIALGDALATSVPAETWHQASASVPDGLTLWRTGRLVTAVQAKRFSRLCRALGDEGFGDAQGSAWTTSLTDATTRLPIASRRWAALMHQVRSCMGFTQRGEATSEETDIRLAHARQNTWLTTDCSALSPATDPTDWLSGEPRPAERRQQTYVLLMHNSDNVAQVREALQEANADRTPVVWTGRR
jgi:hypothetical protein